MRATSWARVRSWLQAGEPERLAQTLVVAGDALGDHRTPDLEDPGVEPVAPAAVVEVAGDEQRLGPLVVPALVEQRPGSSALSSSSLKPRPGDDEPGAEHRAAGSPVPGAGGPERVRREVEAEQVAHEQVDGGDREGDRQHGGDRDADDDDPLLTGLVGGDRPASSSSGTPSRMNRGSSRTSADPPSRACATRWIVDRRTSARWRNDRMAARDSSSGSRRASARSAAGGAAHAWPLVVQVGEQALGLGEGADEQPLGRGQHVGHAAGCVPSRRPGCRPCGRRRGWHGAARRAAGRGATSSRPTSGWSSPTERSPCTSARGSGCDPGLPGPGRARPSAR